MMQGLLTWVAFNPPRGQCNHFAPPLVQTHGCVGGRLRLLFNITPTLAAFPVSLWRCSRFTDGAMWRPQSSDSPTAFLHRPKNAVTCEGNHNSPLSPPSLRVRGHGQVLFRRRKPESCNPLNASGYEAADLTAQPRPRPPFLWSVNASDGPFLGPARHLCDMETDD